MKHFVLIFIVLFSLSAITSCENANVTKLKKWVATENAVCPVNMGIAGDLLNVKYQEKENRVILYFSINEDISGFAFLKKNKEKMQQQMRLSLSQGESRQMLKDVANAKASLMIIFKSPSSGKIIKYELLYDELKELMDAPLISESEIQKLILENGTELENSRCPYKVDDGMTMTKVAWVNNSMVYYCEMDEGLYDIGTLKLNKEELRNGLGEYLENMRNDLAMQKELRMLVNQNMNLQYRYYGNKTKNFVDIKFSPEELSKYLEH